MYFKIIVAFAALSLASNALGQAPPNRPPPNNGQAPPNGALPNGTMIPPYRPPPLNNGAMIPPKGKWKKKSSKIKEL